MMRAANRLLCLLLALVAQAAIAQDSTANAPARPRTPTLDALAGRQFALSSNALSPDLDLRHNQAKGHGLVFIKELEDYLNELLGRIKAAAGVSGLPGRAYIRAQDGLSAEATAAGNIYVDIGLLNNAPNEDAIVGILAHEFGHIMLQHHESDSIFDGLRSMQSLAIVAGGIYQAAMASQGGNAAAAQKHFQKNLGKADVAAYVADNVIHTTWNRDQERDADRFAADMLTRLGYSYEDGWKPIMEKVFQWSERQEALRKKRNAQNMQLVFDMVCPELKQPPSSQYNPNQSLKDGLKQAFKDTVDLHKNCLQKISKTTNPQVATLLSASRPEDGILGFLARKHDSADERLATIFAYREENGHDVLAPSPRDGEWLRIRSDKKIATQMNIYRASLHLMENIDKNPQYVKDLTATAAGKGPLPVYALFRYFQHYGDAKSAEQAIMHAHQGNGIRATTWPVLTTVVDHQLNQNRARDAIAILEQGFVDFGEPPEKIPQMLNYYRRVNYQQGADEMIRRCTFKYPRLRDICTRG